MATFGLFRHHVDNIHANNLEKKHLCKHYVMLPTCICITCRQYIAVNDSKFSILKARSRVTLLGGRGSQRDFSVSFCTYTCIQCKYICEIALLRKQFYQNVCYVSEFISVGLDTKFPWNFVQCVLLASYYS